VREARPDIDGDGLLWEVYETLTAYVIFRSPGEAVAITLWAAATHAQHMLQFGTRLVIRSPEKRCGKSRLLDVLTQLVCRPLVTVNISCAALVRSISNEKPPTLILDEADTVFGKTIAGDEKAETLRGLLNAGFDRDRPYVRWDVTTRQLENCPTFAMGCLAGIGRLPDTIEDRGVIVSLRRKAANETVTKFRTRRDKPAVKKLGIRLGQWVTPYAAALAAAEPDMPDGLNDRAEDAWESLFAVADLAGGEWPRMARKAARMLAQEAEGKDLESRRLLADVQAVFDRYKAEPALWTETLILGLEAIEEAPWADLNHRAGLSPSYLAKLLSAYDIKSRDIRKSTGVRKGYRRADFEDAWSRYLPSGDTESDRVSGRDRNG
jgi:hypothetical protein